MLAHDDLKASSTKENPHEVQSHYQATASKQTSGRLEVTLAKASWNVIRVKVGIKRYLIDNISIMLLWKYYIVAVIP